MFYHNKKLKSGDHGDIVYKIVILEMTDRAMVYGAICIVV